MEEFGDPVYIQNYNGEERRVERKGSAELRSVRLQLRAQGQGNVNANANATSAAAEPTRVGGEVGVGDV